jgi:cytochrome c553
MQIKTIYAVLMVFCIAALSSCEQKSEKEFDIYEESEMASLMRQMAHINEQLKVRIENGEDLGEYPANFEKILTASMTKNQEMDDFFKAHAHLFLNTQKQIYAEPENAQQYYNLAIDACVKCHETKCPGPITRIEKLYLK